MATVVADLRFWVMSDACSSVRIGSMSLIEAMAVVLPAPTGPVKMIL